MSMNAGVDIAGVGVLLAACALVIALLRHAKALRWVAIPFAILVLLGAISIVIPLAAQRHRTVAPATEWRSDQPLLIQPPRLPSASSEVFADVRQRPIEPNVASRQAAIDRQIAAMERRRETAVRVQTATWARLAMIGLPVLAVIGLCIAIPIVCRKWIIRNREIVLPVAGVLSIGVLGMAAVLVAGLVYVRAAADPMQVRYVPSHESVVLPEPMVAPVSVGLRAAAEAPVGVPDQAGTVAGSASAASDSAADGEASATAVAPAAVATDSPAETGSDLPDWIREHATEVNNIDHTPLILASDRWATVQESEAQIEKFAAAALAHQLRQQRVDLSDWQPTRDFVRQSGALQRQFVEQTSLQVGEFESPMYRSYWEVSATPAVSDMAYAQWKAVAIERRLLGLGGGAVALTLLFALTAAGLRIDAATNGRYRGRLTLAAVGFCTAVGAAALFVA